MSLREKARAAGKLEHLEVRLLDRDPEGRWYLIDPLAGGRGFVVPRASGGRISNSQELERHLEQVNLLWGRARQLDEWLPAYEGWKSDPKNQVVLGLRERCP